MANDWSDLREEWLDMCKEETHRVRASAARVFANGVARPDDEGGFAPVDTGNWIANNIASEGKPSKEVNERLDKTGSETVFAIMEEVIHTRNPYQKFYIQNNSHYNDEVEYTGWAKTDPYMPYTRSYARLISRLDKL